MLRRMALKSMRINYNINCDPQTGSTGIEAARRRGESITRTADKPGAAFAGSCFGQLERASFAGCS
jgi:hypothetical protein